YKGRRQCGQKAMRRGAGFCVCSSELPANSDVEGPDLSSVERKAVWIVEVQSEASIGEHLTKIVAHVGFERELRHVVRHHPEDGQASSEDPISDQIRGAWRECGDEFYVSAITERDVEPQPNVRRECQL